MASPISYFSSATKGDLVIASLLITGVNQLGIYLLKARTLDMIKNIPTSKVITTSQATIETSRAAHTQRNTKIMALIEKQNMYKLCSVTISCVAALFCMYKDLSPLNYCLLVWAYHNYTKIEHNRSFIGQLKTKYFSPQAVSRPTPSTLTQDSIDELISFSWITIGVNPNASLIQIIKNRVTQVNIHQLEASTACTSFGFRPNAAFQLEPQATIESHYLK